MDITITPKDASGVERHLDVSIPAEAVAAAEERTARRYTSQARRPGLRPGRPRPPPARAAAPRAARRSTSQARLPGFRPGKAPPTMVRKRFANEIRQETLQALVQDAYQELMERETLDLVTQPHIHDLKFETGPPPTLNSHLDGRPP